MKALAAQSLSGVPTDTERGLIDAEFQELRSEITALAQTTRFNGASLLDGATAAAQAQDYFVGTVVSDTITVAFSNMSGVAGYNHKATSMPAANEVGTASTEE